MVSFHIHMLKTWICTYMSKLSKQCSVHMCKGREGNNLGFLMVMVNKFQAMTTRNLTSNFKSLGHGTRSKSDLNRDKVS